MHCFSFLLRKRCIDSNNQLPTSLYELWSPILGRICELYPTFYNDLAVEIVNCIVKENTSTHISKIYTLTGWLNHLVKHRQHQELRMNNKILLLMLRDPLEWYF